VLRLSSIERPTSKSAIETTVGNAASQRAGH
jgi:hypothetical protein